MARLIALLAAVLLGCAAAQPAPTDGSAASIAAEVLKATEETEAEGEAIAGELSKLRAGPVDMSEVEDVTEYTLTALAARKEEPRWGLGCPSSPYPVLVQGQLRIRRRFKLRNQTVNYFVGRYGVLNAAHLVLFRSESAWKACETAELAVRVPALRSVGPSNDHFLESERLDDPNDGTCLRLTFGEKVMTLCGHSRVSKRRWQSQLSTVIALQDGNALRHAEPTQELTALMSRVMGRGLSHATLFPPAPGTICLGETPLCALAGEQRGLLVWLPVWSSPAPITASPLQRWRVEDVGGDRYTLCKAEADLCLTLSQFVEIPISLPSPPKMYTDCPGSELQCVNLLDRKLGRRPGRNDSLTCQTSCEANPDCKAWTYVRASAAGSPVDQCCLKDKEPDSCRPNRCCDSGFKSHRYDSVKRVPTSTIDGGPFNSGLSMEPIGSVLGQQWALERDDDTGYLYVRADQGGRCLTTSGEKGGKLWVESCADKPGQRWVFNDLL
eukprot:PLAT14630.1.p1 GENE.PLAT14630.1~~PLAT14630.1.p1  ORF type:complete len:497 (-),score=208.76 PLAT14630.1:74-1564(-)